jgi:lipopolysaccharide export system permease protein
MVSVKQQKPELVLQENVFTNQMDGYSIKVGRKDNKTNMLYNLYIYDHTNNKGNESVTVADSGYLRMTEDKKFMVLKLYNGVNYEDVKENSRNRSEKEKYPFRTDKFEEQTIRVKVLNFDFKRGDEGIFKNWYRMLNIRQLNLQEDTLNMDYYKRLRAYMMQINVNPVLTNRTFDLTATHDSLRRNLKVKHDTIYDFDTLFAGIDKWIKADIVSEALSSARNNKQNLNLYQSQLYEKKKTINKYEMERHRKFTLSLAVLIFFFIGAPLGAIIRKGGLGMPVVVSILLFIAYYIVSMMGEKSAREDVWQMFGGMWFSSFVFLPIGIWLSYKAATDAGIMTAETYTRFFNRLGLNRLIKHKIYKREESRQEGR